MNAIVDLLPEALKQLSSMSWYWPEQTKEKKWKGDYLKNRSLGDIQPPSEQLCQLFSSKNLTRSYRKRTTSSWALLNSVLYSEKGEL